VTGPGLIRPDMTAIVNRPFGRRVSYPITASDIRRWALAGYYPEPPPPGYLDRQASESGDLVAPLDFNPFAWGAAESVPSGLEIPADPAYRAVGAMEHNLGVAPPDLRHALNGGVAATYTGEPMRPGDVITAESVISGYSERTGRLGAMLMTDVSTTWTNQDGRAIKTYRMTLIRY
jgi:N-terminal half of MaoC dehydratase